MRESSMTNSIYNYKRIDNKGNRLLMLKSRRENF